MPKPCIQTLSTVFLLLCGASVLFGACRKAEEPAQNKTADEKRAPAPGPGQFDPRLLLSDAATSAHTVRLSPVSAPLEDRRRTAIVTAAIECTHAEAAEKIEKNAEQVQALIEEILSRQSLAAANSVEGKLEIQEEIIRGVNRFLGHAGVKRVHYLNFMIN